MTSQTINASELNGWIYPLSRSENVTRGGNKARSTYDVITMVGGANRSFLTMRLYSDFPSKLYVQNET